MHVRHPSPVPDNPTWRSPHCSGLACDTFAPDSVWLRERAVLELSPDLDIRSVTLHGEVRAHPDARRFDVAAPVLECRIDGQLAGTWSDLAPGPFELTLPIPADAARRGARIELRHTGTRLANALAWLGRVTRIGPLQRFRSQPQSRQRRFLRVTAGGDETLFDFSLRPVPYAHEFVRRHTLYGLNVVGFLTADLGVGESARCMVRAADAAGLPVAPVAVRFPCNSRLGDDTYRDRLVEANPHPVNVFHIDAPSAREIDPHHGPAFRAGKYNIGYLAWELPEFPEAWIGTFDYLDEIWCPSHFVSDAISPKCPLPVVVMPHAISFARPQGDFRARFGLPADRFLFLFLYDLNSFSARKNPQAVISAFRASGLAGRGAALVIKVHNHAAHPGELAALQAAVRDLPDTVLISETLSRAEIYQLESACDCFVSLHRSEGFGLAVAESMYLGKPVISTDWSATAEFVTTATGCPVDCTLTTLTETHGPYAAGQRWAEPDLAHAADWMRRLFADRALAARLGAAARTAIETRFSPQRIGALYRRRLETIAMSHD